MIVVAILSRVMRYRMDRIGEGDALELLTKSLSAHLESASG
jgi:hypothetical protein